MGRLMLSLAALVLFAATAAAVGTKPAVQATPQLADVATSDARWNRQAKLKAQARVNGMFKFAFDNYLAHGFPKDEVRPLTCDGVDTWGGFALTLIDSLDTLAVMGNAKEFKRAVGLVIQHVDFNKDFNTSVFEANIRVVGGLVSAHMIAMDNSWGMKPNGYKGELLDMAIDLADRLMVAFNTPTSMPYGTVNLLHGVPENETSITCTACVGTFLLEFGVLSDLTGDERYREAAWKALESIWLRRSPLNMLGSHINVTDGLWFDNYASIGGGADSLYEYLAKAWLLDGDDMLMDMFEPAFKATEQFHRQGAWHVDVNMFSGEIVSTVFDSLKMFWPGMLILLGDPNSSDMMLREYNRMFAAYPFPPDQYDLLKRVSPEKHKGYFLRPEQLESIMYLYSASKDPQWLDVAWSVLNSLEALTQKACGYTCLEELTTMTPRNRMESFFLAETLKYLYLLFDDGTSLVFRGNYIFTTEAHLIPIDPAKRRRGNPPPKRTRHPRYWFKYWVGTCPVMYYRFGFSIDGLPAPLSTRDACIPFLDLHRRPTNDRK